MAPVTPNKEFVKYDGCSGGMSFLWRKLFKKAPPWEGCCDAHDQPYAKGGTKEERVQADRDLRTCVTKNGHPVWAWLMWAAVRMGGHPMLPTPWRWGFTKPMFTGYTKEPSSLEVIDHSSTQ